MHNTFGRTGIKAILHALAGIAIFIIAQMIASLAFFIPQEIVAYILYAALGITLTYVFLSLYCKKMLHITLTDCRMPKPHIQTKWLICAVCLPVGVSCFFIFLTPGYFSFSNLSTGEMATTLVGAVFSTCIAAGVMEELVFRGFIMKVLEVRWGRAVAIIAPSLLFGLLHIMNMEQPNIIDILVLIVAGTSVGVMFSLITYHSGSIWSSAMAHGVWNLIIIGGILDIGVSHSDTDIFTYTLTSDSTLLTGGAFGIEASLPAVVGYLLIILLAGVLIKFKKK